MATNSGSGRLITKRLATLAVASSLGLSACTGGSSAVLPRVRLSGQVLDASTSLPLAGVKVSVGTQEFTTAADGKYSLPNLPKGGTITFENCAFSTFTLPVPARSGSQNVELQPLPVSGTVTSNLTHRGIAAHIEGKATADTDKRGKVSIPGICPADQLTISAKGYADTTVQVDETRVLKISLQADPKTTAVQEVSWEAKQAWGLACSLVHPDSHKWISTAQCIKSLKDSAAQGYQSVSIKVKSVTYIRWTFPKCSLVSFGPKTYRHTAAINYTLQQSSPAGGVAPFSGIEHLVQTKDGLWRWFPTQGCDFPLT